MCNFGEIERERARKRGRGEGMRRSDLSASWWVGDPRRARIGEQGTAPGISQHMRLECLLVDGGFAHGETLVNTECVRACLRSEQSNQNGNERKTPEFCGFS